MSDNERTLRVRVEQQDSGLARTADLGRRFREMVKERKQDVWENWLDEAQASATPQEMRTFAKGLQEDQAAVCAALSHEWSNGQVEGQVNRLKTLKRQMFGRAKFDLLRRRFLTGHLSRDRCVPGVREKWFGVRRQWHKPVLRAEETGKKLDWTRRRHLLTACRVHDACQAACDVQEPIAIIEIAGEPQMPATDGRFKTSRDTGVHKYVRAPGAIRRFLLLAARRDRVEASRGSRGRQWVPLVAAREAAKSLAWMPQATTSLSSSEPGGALAGFDAGSTVPEPGAHWLVLNSPDRAPSRGRIGRF